MEKILLLIAGALLCSIGFSQFALSLQGIAGISSTWLKTNGKASRLKE